MSEQQFAKESNYSTPRWTRIEHPKATPDRVGRGKIYHHNEETAHREVDLTARKLENNSKIDLETLLVLGQNISIIWNIGFNMVTHTRYVVE